MKEDVCLVCRNVDSHRQLYFYDEIEVDITCSSVYITPIEGGNGFALDHEDFKKVVEEFKDINDEKD